MKPSVNKVAGNQPKMLRKGELKKQVNYKGAGTLFFQIGLIFSLIATIFIMEVKVGYGKVKPEKFSGAEMYEPPTIEYRVEVEKQKQPIAKAKKVQTRPKQNIIAHIVSIVKDDTPDLDDAPIAVTMPIIDVSFVDIPTVTKTVLDANLERNVNQVEFVPIFPGCEHLNSNEEKRQCMSSKIGAFINKRFRSDEFNNLKKNDTHKIYVKFKIDAQGNITEVIARAPQKYMEEEGVRVVRKLPKMTPGRMGDINVPVSYLVPISFKVE